MHARSTGDSWASCLLFHRAHPFRAHHWLIGSSAPGSSFRLPLCQVKKRIIKVTSNAVLSCVTNLFLSIPCLLFFCLRRGYKSYIRSVVSRKERNSEFGAWAKFAIQLADVVPRRRRLYRRRFHSSPPRTKPVLLRSECARRPLADHCMTFTDSSAWRKRSSWRCWSCSDAPATRRCCAINMVSAVRTSQWGFESKYCLIYHVLLYYLPEKLT